MFKVKYFRHSGKSNFNQVIGEQVINFNQFKKKTWTTFAHII